MSDHLGSPAAIVNASSSHVKRYSFNAWGVPRDPDDWTTEFTGELYSGRGFTGHEHLEEFNLINMNGRVYDPAIGRFLSPDPVVQFPDYPNNYNRYSYVLNNPLTFTDPSGYFMDQPGRRKRPPKMYITQGANFGWGYQSPDPWYETYQVQSLGGGGGNPWSFNYISNTYYNPITGERKTADDFNNTFLNPSSASGSGYEYEWGMIGEKTGILPNGEIYVKPIFGYEIKSIFSASNSGGISWDEARTMYQFGGGTPVDVSLSSIDLSRVSMADFNENGLAIIRLDSKHLSNLNDALVHGTITLQNIPGTNQAKIALNSGRDFPELAGQPAAMYDFGMETWYSARSIGRNIETFIGGAVN
jgi:RHS repeat-associated protein